MNDQMHAIESTESLSAESLQAGDTLGRYQLLCPIARGGMGQVWAARQTGRLGLPKVVAIKTAIPMESKDCRKVQEYMFDEAQIAASVDHPNVCKILELGQEQDVLFIAMEWLYGVSLATLVSKLPQRRLTYRIAAHLVAQACSGLHAAHELLDDDGVHMEVVHRDATPHNFMITATGELKVMDFGIVKSKNQQHQATQNGELKGKIAYVAPEQIRGRSVDRRADIFTLGCVLYFITVGKGAFNPDPNQDAGQTILKILYGEYSPPSTVLSDYPPELEAIVAKALDIAPESRFQTADEMRLALEAFLSDGSRSISRDDVADLLQKYCGSAIESRRSEIRSAQRLFDSGQLRSGAYPAAEGAYSVGTLRSYGSQSYAEIPSEVSQGSRRQATAVPESAPSEGAPKRDRRLLWAVLGGAALLCSAVGLLAVLAFGRSGPENSGNTVPSAPAAADPLVARHSPTNLQQRPMPAADSAFPAQYPASEDVERAPRGKGESDSAAPRVGHAARSVKKAALANTAATPATAAPAASTPPSSTQFSQPLTRKPPRHAIDESDPFGK